MSYDDRPKTTYERLGEIFGYAVFGAIVAAILFIDVAAFYGIYSLIRWIFGF